MSSSYLSRLNSGERWLVISVGAATFVLLNAWLIWPHFADWSKLQKRLADSRAKAARYDAAIRQIPTLQADIKKLESEGTYVPPEDQAIQFLRTIQTQANQSGVGFVGSSGQRTSTNQFFVEHAQSVQVASGEKQLVDFLYSLGQSNSLIRVREISVRPDPNRQQLNANITLVASYQKKRGAPPAAARPAAAEAKPAHTPGPPVARSDAAPVPTNSKPAAPKAATPNKK